MADRKKKKKLPQDGEPRAVKLALSKYVPILDIADRPFSCTRVCPIGSQCLVELNDQGAFTILNANALGISGCIGRGDYEGYNQLAVHVVAGLRSMGYVSRRATDLWLGWFAVQERKQQRAADEHQLAELARRLDFNLMRKRNAKDQP